MGTTLPTGGGSPPIDKSGLYKTQNVYEIKKGVDDGVKKADTSGVSSDASSKKVGDTTTFSPSSTAPPTPISGTPDEAAEKMKDAQFVNDMADLAHHEKIHGVASEQKNIHDELDNLDSDTAKSFDNIMNKPGSKDILNGFVDRLNSGEDPIAVYQQMIAKIHEAIKAGGGC